LPGTFGDEVNEQGWQAGSVIPESMLPALAPYLVLPGYPGPQFIANDWFVVVSQTCDVVQPKLENEPLIEVLHCHPINELSGEFKERKSTRRLDFKPNSQSHADVCVQAHAITDRYLVPRELLLQHKPDSERGLSKNAVRNIQGWYSLRYSRPAWPNAFVKRLPAKPKLVSILKPIRDDVAEVRLAIAENEEELADGADYHVGVYFVVDETLWNEDVEGRNQIQSAFAAFTAALKNCKGIVVNEEVSNVYNGAEFSWQMTKMTDEWNFANLSHVE
jgi:hypothetical protein